MSRTPRKLIAIALMAAAMVLPGRRCDGQGKPVVVVATCPLQQIFEKSRHLVVVAGFPDVAAMIDQTALQFTQGLDVARPVILWLQVDAASFQIMGALPVTNLTQWLQATGGTFQDVGDGMVQGQVAGQPVFMQAADGWAIAGQSQAALMQRPADPLQIAAGMEKNYDLALQARPANVPQELRDQTLARLEQLLQFSLQQQASNQSPAQAKLQQASLKNQIELFRRSTTEADSLTLGLQINPGNKKVAFRSTVVPVSGSSLHKAYAAKRNPRSQFASFFVKNATASVSGTQKLTPEETEHAIDQAGLSWEAVSESLSDDQSKVPGDARNLFDSALAELSKLTEQTLREGIIDFAASILIQENRLNAVGACQIADGNLFESAVRQVADGVKAMGVPIEVRMDFEQIDKIRMHAAQIELPPQTELEKAFGKKLTVFVGVSDKQAFVGLGDKSLSAMRRAIAGLAKRSTEPSLPVHYRFSLSEAIQFAAQLTSNSDAQILASAFSGTDNQDNIQIIQQVAPSGASTWQVELDEGIISGFGSAYAQRAAPH